MILVAALSDQNTNRRRGEGVILFQRDAIVAERTFELAVVHLAGRFDRPPGAASILRPPGDFAGIGIGMGITPLYDLMDMLTGGEGCERRLTDSARCIGGQKTNSVGGHSAERRRPRQGVSQLS